MLRPSLLLTVLALSVLAAGAFAYPRVPQPAAVAGNPADRLVGEPTSLWR
jgi:hypothetical protein